MAGKMPNPLTIGGSSGSGGSGGTGGTSGSGGTGGTTRSGCAPIAVGSGSGLRGDYFNNMTLTAPVAGSRTEPVAFNWGSGSPGVGSLGTNAFSVRWSGRVEPRFSGKYTFCTSSDDGVRLWVNNVQLAFATW